LKSEKREVKQKPITFQFGEKEVIEKIEKKKGNVQLTFKLHDENAIAGYKVTHVVLQVSKEDYEAAGSPKVGEAYTWRLN
jgi:hypothetical protein